MSGVNYAVFILFVLPGIIYNQHLFIDDPCILNSTNSQGVCKLISQCQKAREDIRKFRRYPQTCGFQKNQPIVCCPLNTSITPRVAGEISKKKCREYSKYIIEKKPQPILLISAPEIESNECGHKVVKLIIGGEPAGRKEFPHMAAIGYKGENSFSITWRCGGTLISKKYVLTTGHCLQTLFGPAKYVKLGVTNLNDNNHKQEIRVAERIAHPDYTSTSLYNDIGLLKLEEPAKVNSFARPACLYTDNKVIAEKAIATGWGATSYRGLTSDDLLKVTLDFKNPQNCNESYFKNIVSKKLRNGFTEDTQICAGSDDAKDTCQGDSGGPLQVYHIGDNITCMYDIVGITSWGGDCLGVYGAYTKISHYIKWIEDTVWPQES